MKHTIEFNYDGCGLWAYNGGPIMSANEVISYIGRDAFLEAQKRSVSRTASFKVTFEVTVEPIE